MVISPPPVKPEGTIGLHSVCPSVWRQATVSYKKQEGFPQIKNSVVGIPAI